jgi:hypothetical protein
MHGPSSSSEPDAALRSGPSAFPSDIRRVRLLMTFGVAGHFGRGYRGHAGKRRPWDGARGKGGHMCLARGGRRVSLGGAGTNQLAFWYA